jgi:hypothetical protein
MASERRQIASEHRISHPLLARQRIDLSCVCYAMSWHVVGISSSVNIVTMAVDEATKLGTDLAVYCQ